MSLTDIPLKVLFPHQAFFGFWFGLSCIHVLIQVAIFEEAGRYYTCRDKGFPLVLRNIIIGSAIILFLCYLGGVYIEIRNLLHS